MQPSGVPSGHRYAPQPGLRISASPHSLPTEGFVLYRPEPLLGVVDAIWDWNVADAAAARALTIQQAPSTSLLLMASYRAPIEVEQSGFALPDKCATLIHDAVVTLRPTGPLGMLVVQLRPDAAARIVDARLGDFANVRISLWDLFTADAAAACSEKLIRSRTSAERVEIVVTFLLRRLRPPRDSLACRAVTSLRRDPALRMTPHRTDAAASLLPLHGLRSWARAPPCVASAPQPSTLRAAPSQDNPCNGSWGARRRWNQNSLT